MEGIVEDQNNQTKHPKNRTKTPSAHATEKPHIHIYSNIIYESQVI